MKEMFEDIRSDLMNIIMKALETEPDSEKLIAPIIDGTILGRMLTGEKLVLFWESFLNADMFPIKIADGWLIGLTNTWTVKDPSDELSYSLMRWRAGRHNISREELDSYLSDSFPNAYLASSVYGVIPSVIVSKPNIDLLNELSKYPLVTLEGRSDFLINAMLTSIIARELGKVDYADFDSQKYEEILGVNFGEIDGIIVRDDLVYILETKVRIGRRAAQNFKIDIYSVITKLLALKEALPDYDIKAIFIALGKMEQLSDRIIMALKRTRLHIVNGSELIDSFKKLFMEWLYDVLGARIMDEDEFKYLFDIKIRAIINFLEELKKAVREEFHS